MKSGSGSTIILTRAADQNASLAQALSEAGYRCVEIPLTEIVPPADGGAALSRVVESLDHYQLVTITSANGVEALASALQGRRWPSGVEVAVVGAATARKAAQVGLPVDIIPDVATASELVKAVGPAGAGKARVLAPLAEAAADTIEVGLGAKGYVVDRVTAYRSAAPSEIDLGALDGIEAAAITFFAPSSVDRWVSVAKDLTPAQVCCIGPSTAARAHERGLVGISVAEPHSEAGVLALIRAQVGLAR